MPALAAKTVLRWAMEIETNGETFYQAVAAQTANRDVKLLFEDLAYQEERHYKTFERLMDKAAAGDASAAAVAAYEEYLQVALQNALFAGPEKGLALAKEANDEEAALRAAIAFEKDTLLFFYDLRDMVPDEQKGAIVAIIEEERKHVRQLVGVLKDRPWVS